MTGPTKETEATPIRPLTPGAAHRAVRNVLANEYGLTRGTIESLVRDSVLKEVRNILEHQVLTSKRVDAAIQQAVHDFVKDGLPGDHWRRPQSFQEFVVAEIRKSIQETILERFDVSISPRASNTGENQ